MISHRTTARGAVLLILIAAAVAAASVAGAAQKQPIVFPLLSDVPVFDNYGDPRANGRHAGIDIEGATRRTPVLAAEAGKVRWHTTSSRAGCMLYLYGASGTTYLYIHLNNDVTLRNDNRGRCELGTAYTVADGAKVTAGQQIALNGDSGDADGNPHLHFEVHPDDGADVNPLPYLKSATRLLFPGRLGAKFTLGLRGTHYAAGKTTVAVKVTAVRWWPNGRWTPLARIVSLKLPAGSSLADPQSIRSGAPRGVSAGGVDGTITVFTSPSKVTKEALRGEDGILRATRIRQADGTTLDLESQPEQPEPEPDPEGEDVDDGETEAPPRPF